MQLLVVAATEREIAAVRSQKISADYLITGVGSPACLYTLTKVLQGKKYDYVIQAGIAGSFTTDIQLGETFLVERDGFADLAILEGGRLSTLFEAGLADKDEWPYTGGWLVNQNDRLLTSGLKKVAGLTVNTVGENPDIAAQYRQLYHADLESMEGAACHYVCLQEHIPFMQIRSVSNRVGERNKSNWHMKEAIENLNKELLVLINQTTHQL